MNLPSRLAAVLGAAMAATLGFAPMAYADTTTQTVTTTRTQQARAFTVPVAAGPVTVTVQSTGALYAFVKAERDTAIVDGQFGCVAMPSCSFVLPAGSAASLAVLVLAPPLVVSAGVTVSVTDSD